MDTNIALGRRRRGKPVARACVAAWLLASLLFGATAGTASESPEDADRRKMQEASVGETQELVDDGPDLTRAEAEAVEAASLVQEFNSNNGVEPFAHGVIEINGSVRDYLVVYLAAGTLETDFWTHSSVRKLSDEARERFRFVHTDVDAAALKTAWQAIESGRWRGVDSKATASFGVDGQRRQIVVRVDDRVSEAELAALRSINLGLVAVETGERIERTSDRHNDYSPHWGAARLKKSGQSWHCSSGFSVVGRTTGTRYSLTAGHCGSNGLNLYSGSHFYGEMAGKSGFPARDMARLKGSSYRNTIWTDGADVYNWRTVVGANDGSLDQKLCISGAKSLARCHVKIVDQNESISFPDGTTNNLMVLQRYTGSSAACQGGDSGGVAYHRNPENRRANVKGIIVGSNGSTLCFIHKYSTIRSHLNVDVLTS